MDDEVLGSPFFPHILDAWSKRNHPNMHFMFYEDMKKVVIKFSNSKFWIVYNTKELSIFSRIYKETS